jgi:hypothetical protein
MSVSRASNFCPQKVKEYFISQAMYLDRPLAAKVRANISACRIFLYAEIKP